MVKLNDKTVVTLWREATRLAGVALAGDSGLPDKVEIDRVACALISAGLVMGKAGQAINRAGQDSEQDAMLSDAYRGKDGDESGN
jgi:hypothetical protein